MAGIYLWEYSTGSFPVCLRPNGVFYCSAFNTPGSWSVKDEGIFVDWQKYGRIQFVKTGEGLLEGSLEGFPDKWRKLKVLSSFSDGELLLFGNGGGSVWKLEWEKGSFDVEFRADGFNHFVCPSFPAHSHWSLSGDKVLVNWGKYGDYEFNIDASSRVMNGNKVGQPKNWRRLTFIRPLELEALSDVPSHDHSHSHDHGGHCDAGCDGH